MSSTAVVLLAALFLSSLFAVALCSIAKGIFFELIWLPFLRFRSVKAKAKEKNHHVHAYFHGAVTPLGKGMLIVGLVVAIAACIVMNS